MKFQTFKNLDANEGVFFQRQLEHIKAKTYDIKYPTLKIAEGMIVPQSFEADSGAQSITYRQYDQVGVAKLIANYADDLPRADVKGIEVTVPVKGIGESFGYNIQEIRAAAKAGFPLTPKKANAARRAVMQKLEAIGFSGDTATGLVGFNGNANATEVTLPADGTGASTTFASKTAAQIIRDLNAMASAIVDATLGVEIPDTLLLPIAQYSDIATRQLTNTEVTVLQFFLKNSPYIKSVGWLNQLKTGGAGSTTRMIAYRRDPDALTLEIPQNYEQLAPQERNLEYVVPCHMRTGGVIFYYPLAMAFADGL